MDDDIRTRIRNILNIVVSACNVLDGRTIETQIENGVVSDRQKGVISYREGKSKALLARTGGVAPYFASGNSEGDRWLLECSTDLRLVMSAAPAESRHSSSTAATAHGWERRRASSG